MNGSIHFTELSYVLNKKKWVKSLTLLLLLFYYHHFLFSLMYYKSIPSPTKKENLEQYFIE